MKYISWDCQLVLIAVEPWEVFGIQLLVNFFLYSWIFLAAGYEMVGLPASVNATQRNLIVIVDHFQFLSFLLIRERQKWEQLRC